MSLSFKKKLFSKIFCAGNKNENNIKTYFTKKNIAKKASEMKSNKNCSVITKCVLKREEMK